MHQLLVKKKWRPLRLEASMPPSASAGIAKRKQFENALFILTPHAFHDDFHSQYTYKAPLYTIYTPTTKLEMLVKPMKNKKKYKTPKVNDNMLTSSIEHDIQTRFDNDATKKCISNSNPKPSETSCFGKVSLAWARSTF